MRKIREILRLVWGCNRSRRDTAKACVIGKCTVNDTIARAIAAVLCWPIVLNDEALEKLLYFPPQPRSSRKLHQLDWQGLE